MWLFFYSTRKAAGKTIRMSECVLSWRNFLLLWKRRVFMWCCSLVAKQKLQGFVLQLGCVAESPGPQPLLCLPALTSWGDHPRRRSQDGLSSGSRTQIAGGAIDHIKRVIHGLVFPKMCLWISSNTHSCLREMVDICHELHPTVAALGEQGAWEWIRRQVSASLMHCFSSLTPGMELARLWGSSGTISTKLQARTELFLAVYIWKRPILHVVLLEICWIRG